VGETRSRLKKKINSKGTWTITDATDRIKKGESYFQWSTMRLLKNITGRQINMLSRY
jgi:hypothetical protein